MSEQENNLTCPLTDTARETSKKDGSLQHIEGQGETHSADEFLSNATDRLEQINKELMEGFETIKNFPQSVTFYGSARLKPGTEYYEKARRLGNECCKAGYGVITGGGPGIMQAGNQGTHEACGTGIGFNIVLPFEQHANEYVTHGVDFQYFFTRKFAMNYSGEAYLCFPGGFGTLDEFFEILTLVQTGKVQKVPIILVGSDFWGPIMEYSKNILRDKFETISPEDIDLFHVMDDEEEIMKMITTAPLRGEYYNTDNE